MDVGDVLIKPQSAIVAPTVAANARTSFFASTAVVALLLALVALVAAALAELLALVAEVAAALAELLALVALVLAALALFDALVA